MQQSPQSDQTSTDWAYISTCSRSARSWRLRPFCESGSTTGFRGILVASSGLQWGRAG